MDVAGTPTGVQRGVIAGAIQWLDWVNSMVSAPAYDQGNSVHYSHVDGVPYDKITVAYYAGTWVNNCNAIGGAAASKWPLEEGLRPRQPASPCSGPL